MIQKVDLFIWRNFVNGNDECAIHAMMFFHGKYLPKEVKDEIDLLVIDMCRESAKRMHDHPLLRAGMPRLISSSPEVKKIAGLIMRKYAQALPERCGTRAVLKRSFISGGISTIAGLLIFVSSGWVALILLLATIAASIHQLHTSRLYFLAKTYGIK